MSETNYKESVAIVIPSLSPDEKMIHLIEDIRNAGYQKILVINDGSANKYHPFYEDARDKYHCDLLVHAVNLGKGRALKDAFNWILVHWPDCVGAVTVDSDGQHRVEDMDACAQALIAEPDKLVLGCRDFSDKSVPFRSKFGNIMTRNVLKVLCGIKLSDTQTGLRGISRKLMGQFLETKGERFEYEMNMIVETKEKNIGLREVPIQTVYIEENKSSHFNPLKDSIKIYSVFLKYIFSSFSSFIVDIALFSLLVSLLRDTTPAYYIYISTVGARIVSSLFNFTLNRKTVFKSMGKVSTTMAKYFTLCVVQMCLSAICVELLFQLFGSNETLIKILVDMLLFVVSFQIQREWVFRSKKGEE